MHLTEQLEVLGDGAFEHCLNMRKLTFGPKLKKIPARAFKECKGIEEIDLPAKLTEIGDEAFLDCVRLRKAFIPADATIGKNAFKNTKMMLTK